MGVGCGAASFCLRTDRVSRSALFRICYSPPDDSRGVEIKKAAGGGGGQEKKKGEEGVAQKS